MQVIIFQTKLYAYHWTTRKKSICTLSSHRATRELYAKVHSYRAPVGALCEGSMRIELRSELYAKGALCGSTMHICTFKKLDKHHGILPGQTRFPGTQTSKDKRSHILSQKEDPCFLFDVNNYPVKLYIAAERRKCGIK